jgi:hypothetical protein
MSLREKNLQQQQNGSGRNAEIGEDDGNQVSCSSQHFLFSYKRNHQL